MVLTPTQTYAEKANLQIRFVNEVYAHLSLIFLLLAHENDSVYNYYELANYRFRPEKTPLLKISPMSKLYHHTSQDSESASQPASFHYSPLEYITQSPDTLLLLNIDVFLGSHALFAILVLRHTCCLTLLDVNKGDVAKKDFAALQRK